MKSGWEEGPQLKSPWASSLHLHSHLQIDEAYSCSIERLFYKLELGNDGGENLMTSHFHEAVSTLPSNLIEPVAGL